MKKKRKKKKKKEKKDRREINKAREMHETKGNTTNLRGKG